MTSRLEVNERLRREQNILDRLENVRRLIQMETTLLTATGAEYYPRFQMTDREGKAIGNKTLLEEVRDDIQLQLLSITALCYGDNPDVGEPDAMIEWKEGSEDRFRDTWEECLSWNA